jgi:hypothetical protein
VTPLKVDGGRRRVKVSAPANGKGMTEPLSLETLLSEFGSSETVWALRDARSGRYVTIPHQKYPGRLILHFFMSRDDAETLLKRIIETGNKPIAAAPIAPVKVNLHEIASRSRLRHNSGNAAGFVVHPPNEVFEYEWRSDQDTPHRIFESE